MLIVAARHNFMGQKKANLSVKLAMFVIIGFIESAISLIMILTLKVY